MEALKRAVRTYADRHADSDGLAIAPVPGLRMMRACAPGRRLRSMYRPLVCLVLQGAKELTAGGMQQVFVGGQSVIVGVDLPVIGRIVKASRGEPYLALAIELDMSVMQSVALDMGAAPETGSIDAPLFVESLDDTILNCATRLMRLIDHPQGEPVVRPAILRELHYWLLCSRHGPALRNLCLPDGHTQRITRAIDIIRSNFHEAIPVERLAGASNLSPSAFHRHFKAVTSLSPLQFQKHLRLIEARRLMLNEGFTATRAANAVGYESPSQFSREYGRMFGAPPRQDQRTGTVDRGNGGKQIHASLME